MIETPFWVFAFVLSGGFGIGFFIRVWVDEYLAWFDRYWVRRCKVLKYKEPFYGEGTS